MTNMVPWSPPPPPTTVEEEPLTIAEYQAIKNWLAAQRNGQVYLLITKLLFNTGLRIAEVMRLTAGHLMWEGPNTYIWAYRGKTRASKWEKVALHPELGAEIRGYLTWSGRRSGPIIPIKVRAFQLKFREAGIAAIGRPTHPHQLRHLFAITMRNAGVPIQVTSHLMGHSKPETTQRYYNEVDADTKADIAALMPI